MLVVFVGLDDVHGVGAAKVVDVEEVVPLLEEVVGEVAVGLVALSSVDHLAPVPIEDSPLAVLLPEALLEALSQSIHVFAVDLAADFKIVIAEDEWLVVGGEEYGSILLADDSEIEGGLSVLEGKASVVEREGEVGFGVDGEDAVLGHFESFVVLINDFEGEVEEGVGMEGEGKHLGDGTALFDVVGL